MFKFTSDETGREDTSINRCRCFYFVLCCFGVRTDSAQRVGSGSQSRVQRALRQVPRQDNGRTPFWRTSLISEKVAAVSADDLSNIITNGKGHMPKFANKLTPDQIDALVHQIQSLNKKISIRVWLLPSKSSLINRPASPWSPCAPPSLESLTCTGSIASARDDLFGTVEANYHRIGEIWVCHSEFGSNRKHSRDFGR